MKKILSIFAAFFLVQSVQAQQEPLFAQYMNNAFLINPAVAGSNGTHSINLFHRWQWVSFPGAPQTFGVSYQGLIKNVHGVGGLIFSDITGPSVRIGAKTSYAFHIPINDDMRLSIGAAARIVRNSINTRTITFLQDNDAAVANASEAVWGGDAEFGLYFYSRNYYVGFSAPNLIQTKIDFGANPTGRDPLGKGYRHYFLTGGYKFHIPEKKMIIEPSVMLKYVKGPMPQIDGGVTLRLLNDQLAFGCFYRNPGFISFQSKFVFDNSIPLLISFDVSTARFQNYSVGATEVILGYDFKGSPMFENNKVQDMPKTTN
jgi:type IX secretion system PorP/SprF family membrane protein